MRDRNQRIFLNFTDSNRDKYTYTNTDDEEDDVDDNDNDLPHSYDYPPVPTGATDNKTNDLYQNSGVHDNGNY